MPEPASTTAAAIAAAASGITLALLGVDYYSLLYGLIGALWAMSQAGAMTKVRAVVYVLMSTVVGAAIGSGGVALIGSSSRAVLILACLVAGAGAHLLVTAAVKAAVTRIESLGPRS